ncbi:class I SAM-dependent methyltransferase [Streptomyces roseolilacinus]|uniref:hypothetical protein n=1 Tax=Streptomyces roseolilacinus TaxID=66904 RepID=UPI0038284BC8
MRTPTARYFHDDPAADHDLLHADRDVSVARQGAAPGDRVTRTVGPGTYDEPDCACGIGTQALGLAARGHRVTGTDLGPVAAAGA